MCLSLRIIIASRPRPQLIRFHTATPTLVLLIMKIWVLHNGAVILITSDCFTTACLYTDTSQRFSASHSNTLPPQESNSPVGIRSDLARNGGIIAVPCKCIGVGVWGPNPNNGEYYARASFPW